MSSACSTLPIDTPPTEAAGLEVLVAAACVGGCAGDPQALSATLIAAAGAASLASVLRA